MGVAAVLLDAAVVEPADPFYAWFGEHGSVFSGRDLDEVEGAPGVDFTYVRTWAGFSYVAFIVNVFARRIVASHASTSKSTDLVMTPLRMALWQRDRGGQRDRRRAPRRAPSADRGLRCGSRYTSLRLTEHLALQGIRPSIDTVVDALDNALMETINGL